MTRSLHSLLVVSTALVLGRPVAAEPAAASPAPAPTTRAAQAALTPAQALERLVAGNARFVSGRMLQRDWKQAREQTASGQYPFAFVLSCVDSRTSSELIFDQGMGDIFNARVAGNVIDDDILGSMEFACKVAGARLIAVVGHTQCGAVKGACTDAKLGHLTGLLAKIRPAVDATREKMPQAAPTDGAFVETVADTHVQLVVQQIRARSAVLREMLDAGQIGVAAGIHDLATGRVTFKPASP